MASTPEARHFPVSFCNLSLKFSQYFNNKVATEYKEHNLICEVQFYQSLLHLLRESFPSHPPHSLLRDYFLIILNFVLIIGPYHFLSFVTACMCPETTLLSSVCVWVV